MPVSIGTTTVTALFLGTTSITSAYLGNTQVFGGSFTPLSLFSGGSQGIWLDPSDLSTMFEDLAGTVPITTPGTPVGKRLDKSGRGNHATAPTLGARPVYGREPKGGRRNLLLATDTLATQSLTVAAVAHTLAFTGTGTVTLSGASTAGPLVGTGAGNRVSLTFTPTAASLTLTVSGSVTLGQLQLGSTDTAYQKVTNAYDITESGVATCHYVQYDGSDDSMSTSAIDFTATDKMSVFAGVRKLSNTGTGMVVELGPVTADVRSFNFAAPNGGSNYALGLLQRVTSPALYATGWAAPFVAPTTNVVTGIFDWAGVGDAGKIVGRVNAAAQTLDFTNRNGTLTAGNFGNLPLYIGRRNNATLPFNGKDYGIIVVGKAASAGEITDTETWLAAKTSGVTI